MRRHHLRHQWTIISDFRHSINARNIMSVPTALKSVLESDAWKMWIEPAGLVREHQSFYSFITTPPMKGCGFDPDLVEAFLKKAVTTKRWRGGGKLFGRTRIWKGMKSYRETKTGRP
jgi:hypothetical protein